MARADTLALLAKVVDSLKPLADRARGAPLRADDWNTVVSAVTDLAELITTREENVEALLDQRYARANHDHSGAAGLSWFEPATRQLLERAGGGSVDQSTAIARLDKSLGELRDQWNSLTGRLEALSARVDGVRDTDVKRERDIQRVALDLESARTIETRVTGLANQLGGFDESRRAILEFRDSLRDATGAPIDVGRLSDGVGQIEDLRARLTLANGELGRLRDIQTQITRLEDKTTVDIDSVRGVVRGALADPDIFDTEPVEGRVRSALRGEFTQRFEGLDERLNGLDSVLADVSGSLTGTAEQVSGLAETVGGFAGEFERLSGIGERVSGLTERITATEAVANAARAETERLSGLRGELAALTDRTGSLEARLADDLGRLAGDLDVIRGDIRTIQVRVDPNGPWDRQLQALTVRVDTLAADTARLQDLEGRMARQEQLMDGTRAELATLNNRTATIDTLSAQVNALAEDRRTTDQLIEGIVARQDRLDLGLQGIDRSIVPLNERITQLDARTQRLQALNETPARPDTLRVR